MLKIPYLHDSGYLEIRGDTIGRSEQFFSHRDLTGVYRHFDISKMWRLVEATPDAYEQRQFDVRKEEVDYMIVYQGVELSHLTRLTAESARKPGLIVEFKDKDHIVIDGSHRYIKLFALGQPEMTFYVLTEEQVRPVLLDIPDKVADRLIGIQGDPT